MLAMHKPFHLVYGMVTDVLHAVGVGIVKMLLNCWFSKSKQRERYSICHKVSRCHKPKFITCALIQLGICDAKLMKIAVPNVIKRPPKSLTEHTKWKGTYFNELIV